MDGERYEASAKSPGRCGIAGVVPKPALFLAVILKQICAALLRMAAGRPTSWSPCSLPLVTFGPSSRGRQPLVTPAVLAG